MVNDRFRTEILSDAASFLKLSGSNFVRMFQRTCILILFFALALASTAQDTTEYVAKQPPKERKDTRSLKDRLWFGGGLGLSFGTITAIQVEPMVGYKVDQKGKFSVGTGINYTYISDGRYVPRYEYSVYGYRFFSRYRVIEQAFLHGEYLSLNTERFDPFIDAEKRIWVPHLLVGGGYVQALGSNSSFTIQALWEVLQNPNSVYRGQGPIISAGFGLGF